MQLAGAAWQLLWGRDAPTATCYKKWQKITLACRCFVILTPATPSSATSPHYQHTLVSVPLSVAPTPALAPALGPSATHSMHYLHLSELLRICRCTNESFGPWLVTDNALKEDEDHDDEYRAARAAAAQADDAANELLPDFQWHSTGATATTRASASKCDMSRDLNWRCCRKCALICQRTLPNTPIPRRASP